MNRKIFILIFLLAFLVSGCSISKSKEIGERITRDDIPNYFLVVRNKSYHGLLGSKYELENDYLQLVRMVAQADEYKIKLTLMFSPYWVDYILEDKERIAEFAKWKKSGHEIGAYHENIYQINWDGYSDHPREEISDERAKRKGRPEGYLGDMNDFMKKMQELDPDIISGCLNDEDEKLEIPKQIIYDTCSGYANFGEKGRKIKDEESPQKGINEYINLGFNGSSQKRWLSTYHLTDTINEELAEGIFHKMRAGVYGAVVLSNPKESDIFFDWLYFLHSQDPESKKSKTFTEIMTANMLPIEQLP